MQENVALSFSGGKDSCLALHTLQQQGVHIACLLTTAWKENQETVAHGEHVSKLEKQAEKLGIPIHFIETDFESYGVDFLLHLKLVKEQFNLSGIAFGDIYIEGHREWGEKLAQQANLDSMYPLWDKQENVLPMLKRFVDLGFKAKVIKIDEEKLPSTWVGRAVDESFIEDIMTYDVCPMGESGEYHTAVYDGPIFIHS